MLYFMGLEERVTRPVHEVKTIDVAVLTVIGTELHAVQRVLKIESRDRIPKDGFLYWETTRYSKLQDRDLTIVVHCIGSASQASASAATTRLLTYYDPAILILLGIAAGWRGKLKIGDVAVARDIADLSINVVENGERHPRPVNRALRPPVTQMIQNFRLDGQSFAVQFTNQFGKAIELPKGEEDVYRDNVATIPTIRDCTIASADDLLRDGSAFDKMSKYHQGIRAAEMEAGGFSRACEDRDPPKPWMVIRGISDFADEFKGDRFHDLASCAAAVYLDLFLYDGCDIDLLRPNSITQSSISAATISPQEDEDGKKRLLSPLASEFINDQFEKLAQALSAARVRDIESIREGWRVSGGREAMEKLKALKEGQDWKILTPTTRAIALRLEASLVLALDSDVNIAKTLALEALKQDGDRGMPVLQALITYHEKGARTALANLQEVKSLDAWNVKLAFLLDSGKSRDVLDEYPKPPIGITPDTESRRLYALALLGEGRLTDAQREIQLAVTEHPQWFSVRFASAIIGYFDSLSPALFKRIPKFWPVPADLKLVKRDKDTLKQLRKSEALFAELLNPNGMEPIARREIEGWRLACLANDAEKHAEAQKYCAELLERDPTHPIAILWASARDYISNLEENIREVAVELEVSQ